ncbi:MAG: hypothetical protein HUJ63_05175, partial [Enterococcus sp.]|nr:hypothetical protein [Enterococcus sp.]
SSLFSLPPRPCHAYFKNNGRVDLEINVAVGNGVLDIPKLCTNIQQEVAANVNMMCETVPVQVEIHVSKDKPKNPVKPVEVKTQKPKKQ